MFFRNVLYILILIEYINCWSYNPICWLKECCDDETIPGNIAKLRATLKERVYGQHLVEAAIDALKSHLDLKYQTRKALTLSFHGWPGSGKNYVADFIADSMYKLGTKSSHVHHFIGRIHFPLQEHSQQYKDMLYTWLKGNITRCPKQLFIFDEVDKMPSTVLNGIKPMIDYRSVVDGVDYTKAIFIFLSNTGAGLINEYYLQQWEQGRKREELQLSEFEVLITQGAFNEEGGFHHSDTIKSNLIDHYIPFLPMQEKHVIECIKDEFKQRHVLNPKLSHIREVLEFIEWGPDPSKLFSKTGCKRISSKVGVLVAKHYSEMDKTEL